MEQTIATQQAPAATQAPSALPTLDLPFELDVLRLTVNYQGWLRDTALPFMGRRILEVGSGIGNMSQHLPLRDSLVLSEIDDNFRAHLAARARELFNDDPRVKIKKIDLQAPDCLSELRHENLDTIVSFNVLEHIEDDLKALATFTDLLRASNAPGPKRIITLVPAHQWAYGEIDRNFGHHRRYGHKAFQKMLNEIDPRIQHHYQYMNFIGVFGWVWLGRIRKLKNFGIKSATAFERFCPYIRDIDDFLHRNLRLPIGQSLLSVATLPQTIAS